MVFHPRPPLNTSHLRYTLYVLFVFNKERDTLWGGDIYDLIGVRIECIGIYYPILVDQVVLCCQGCWDVVRLEGLGLTLDRV